MENFLNEVEAMRARKDSALLDRSQVVAALAKCFSSGVAKTGIEGWSEDWHNCVYIDLPTGQVSWHFNDSHAYLFNGLPAYKGKWDGHDTPEKYRRLAALAAPAVTAQDEGEQIEIPVDMTEAEYWRRRAFASRALARGLKSKCDELQNQRTTAQDADNKDRRIAELEEELRKANRKFEVLLSCAHTAITPGEETPVAASSDANLGKA